MSTFEGPYKVTEVARNSNYYYPGQSIYVVRAVIPIPRVQTGTLYGAPIYSYAPRSGLYYICLVAPGTIPTMDPNDPTQQLVVTFGDNNL